MRVREAAPAKINLSLHVGPPGQGGRHPLESIVAFADVGDVVWAEEADRPSLGLAGPFAAALAQERDNLVVRAARTLADAARVRAGVKLTLEKNLPIASGIGGGSADAAAALRALNRLWKLDIALSDLQRLAATLGADVPACVAARSCVMQGDGEETAPLALPVLHAVLANPGVPLATRDVYAAFDARGGGAFFSRNPAPAWTNASDALAGLAAMRNDLAPPARTLAPAIDDAMSMLEASPRTKLARLSGSGATVFALVETATDARALAEEIARARPSWWVRAARLGG